MSNWRDKLKERIEQQEEAKTEPHYPLAEEAPQTTNPTITAKQPANLGELLVIEKLIKKLNEPSK
jgi:hypothetical protein